LIAILQRVNLYQRLAPSFREHLVGTQRGVVPETPKRTHPAFAHVTARVIANNRAALDAAAAKARESGISQVTVADAALGGEAAVAGAARLTCITSISHLVRTARLTFSWRSHVGLPISVRRSTRRSLVVSMMWARC